MVYVGEEKAFRIGILSGKRLNFAFVLSDISLERKKLQI